MSPFTSFPRIRGAHMLSWSGVALSNDIRHPKSFQQKNLFQHQFCLITQGNYNAKFWSISWCRCFPFLNSQCRNVNLKSKFQDSPTVMRLYITFSLSYFCRHFYCWKYSSSFLKWAKHHPKDPALLDSNARTRNVYGSSIPRARSRDTKTTDVQKQTVPKWRTPWSCMKSMTIEPAASNHQGL